MADKLIKSKQRVKDFAEVFTPKHIVKDMYDLAPEEMWISVDTTFLGSACDTVNFLAEEAKLRLFRMYIKRYPDLPEIVVLKATQIVENNIVCGDFIKEWKDERSGKIRSRSRSIRRRTAGKIARKSQDRSVTADSGARSRDKRT